MKFKIATLVFLVAGMLFLLPWISVSCGGTKLGDVSGIQLVTGVTYNSTDLTGSSVPQQNHSNSEPLVVAAFIVALVGITFGLIKFNPVKLNGFDFTGGLLGIAGAVLLILMKNKFDGQVNQALLQSSGIPQGIIQVQYLAAFWLTLGAFLLAAVASLLNDKIAAAGFFSTRSAYHQTAYKSAAQPTDGFQRPSRRAIDVSPTFTLDKPIVPNLPDAVNFCIKCGRSVREDMNYCKNCGVQIKREP